MKWKLVLRTQQQKETSYFLPHQIQVTQELFLTGGSTIFGGIRPWILITIIKTKLFRATEQQLIFKLCGILIQLWDVITQEEINFSRIFL